MPYGHLAAPIQLIDLDTAGVAGRLRVRRQDLCRVSYALDRPVAKAAREFRRVGRSTAGEPVDRGGDPGNTLWHGERERNQAGLQRSLIGPFEGGDTVGIDPERRR